MESGFPCGLVAAGLVAVGVALHSSIHQQLSCYGRVPGGGLAAVGLGRRWWGWLSLGFVWIRDSWFLIPGFKGSIQHYSKERPHPNNFTLPH